jgi:hypothetical protein
VFGKSTTKGEQTMAIRNAIKALGYKGHAQAIEIVPGRYRVTLNGEYFGIWDAEKNTFVD